MNRNELDHPHNFLTGRYGAYIAFAFGFANLFSFPAIPIGNTFAIDATLAMTAGLLLLHPTVFFGPGFPFILLIVVPLVQSALAAFASGGVIAPELIPKTIVTYILDVIPLVAAYEILRAGRFRQFLLGVSLAVPAHGLIAMYQIRAFDQGFVPFLGILSTNPGMGLPSEMSDVYADFVQRPFGLFAEPSAMVGCIGPWLVLFAGLASSPARFPALRVHRGILGLALLSGCFLLAVSESGHSPVVLAGMVLAVLGTRARKDDASARRLRSWAAAVLMVGAVVATAIEFESRFSARGLEGRRDSSWDRRIHSFLFVWDALSHDVKTFLFGVGPGQSYPLIMASARFTGGLGPEVTAVWSTAGGYVAEAGFFGLACLGVMAGAFAVSIWTSTERTLGIACAIVWLLGMVFATNYPQQPAIWFFLAVLLNWNKLLGLRQVTAIPSKSTGVLATP